MKYLFVLGCHRSGTTMLQQALNRHSQIAIPPETKYFSSFLGHSHRCQIRRLDRINNDLQIDLLAPLRAIRNTADARSFYDQMGRAYLRRLDKPGVVYFGEKTPAHSGYVAQIDRILPESKFIWIYRDGRDVAASMRTTEWMSKQLAVNFLIWLFYYRKQLRAADDRRLDIQFIKYEELVRRPVEILREVTDFLGLPFEPAVARGHGNLEGVLEWELPWKQRALQPITTNRIETWRKELNDGEVELLEWLGGRALRSLGYALSAKQSGWSNIIHCPKILLGMLRFTAQIPFDEAANQFVGKPICVG